MKPSKEIMAPWNNIGTFRKLQRKKLTLAFRIHIFALDLESNLRLDSILAY
jgi:hypothetical protein